MKGERKTGERRKRKERERKNVCACEYENESKNEERYRKVSGPQYRGHRTFLLLFIYDIKWYSLYFKLLVVSIYAYFIQTLFTDRDAALRNTVRFVNVEVEIKRGTTRLE